MMTIMVETHRVDCATRLGDHIVGKHRVEMDVSQMVINQGRLDGFHKSAENVLCMFWFLMDCAKDVSTTMISGAH